MNRLILEAICKKKLILLCNFLLPDYSFKDQSKPVFQCIKWRSLSGDGEFGYIHWVELCLTQITTKLDDLYCAKYIDEINRKAGPYPENWNELWANRPYHTVWNNFNLGYPKKNMVDYLDNLYKELTN